MQMISAEEMAKKQWRFKKSGFLVQCFERELPGHYTETVGRCVATSAKFDESFIGQTILFDL